MHFPKIDTIALTAAAAVAAGTVAGSASSLCQIGHDVGLAAPWSLPLAIDAAAMVAGICVRARRQDTFAWAVLVGMTLVSAGLQWIETGSPVAGLVPLGALFTLELAMHLLPESVDVAPVKARPVGRRAELEAAARELNIAGRSKMRVAELETAVADARRLQVRSA